MDQQHLPAFGRVIKSVEDLNHDPRKNRSIVHQQWISIPKGMVGGTIKIFCLSDPYYGVEPYYYGAIVEFKGRINRVFREFAFESKEEITTNYYAVIEGDLLTIYDRTRTS